MIKDSTFRTQAEPLVGGGAKWASGDATDKPFKKAFSLTPEVTNWLKETLRKYGQI